MKWMFISGAIIILAILGAFAWVYWLAFGNARISGVEPIPAMLFMGMCLATWTLFLQMVDMLNDWVAARAKADIGQVQGEVAAGIREGARLQREQANTLAATLRAFNAAQGNTPAPVPVGGLDFDEN